MKLQIGVCNGQISTFELSTIIMRPVLQVMLGDHRTFVVGPFEFSINWPIQTDRDAHHFAHNKCLCELLSFR